MPRTPRLMSIPDVGRGTDRLRRRAVREPQARRGRPRRCVVTATTRRLGGPRRDHPRPGSRSSSVTPLALVARIAPNAGVSSEAPFCGGHSLTAVISTTTPPYVDSCRKNGTAQTRGFARAYRQCDARARRSLEHAVANHDAQRRAARVDVEVVAVDAGDGAGAARHRRRRLVLRHDRCRARVPCRSHRRFLRVDRHDGDDERPRRGDHPICRARDARCDRLALDARRGDRRERRGGASDGGSAAPTAGAAEREPARQRDTHRKRGERAAARGGVSASGLPEEHDAQHGRARADERQQPRADQRRDRHEHDRDLEQRRPTSMVSCCFKRRSERSLWCTASSSSPRAFFISGGAFAFSGGVFLQRDAFAPGPCRRRARSARCST